MPPGSLLMGHPESSAGHSRLRIWTASTLMRPGISSTRNIRAETKLNEKPEEPAKCDASDCTKFQAIKGGRDILPPDSELWNRFEHTAREVFGTYAIGEIRLPIFEATELFARSIGTETDVVSKEMYTFEVRDMTSVTLRPEATASWCAPTSSTACRQLPGNQSCTTWGRCFGASVRRRADTASFTRLARRFGREIVRRIDAEVIEMLLAVLRRLGI